jgi:arabinan endo-1,5-alpha-L-arabinosidase
MSCHYEADYRQGGRSVLGIRPLLWKNDWPYAGDRFQGGTFEIESERRGYALELAVDFVRQNVQRAGGFGFGNRGNNNTPVKPIGGQKLEDVIETWPKGDIPVRIGDYMFRPHQRWTITPVAKAGGYLGGPYYKIVIEGTNRALAATADLELSTAAEFNGSDEQLWRIEQAIDGTFRIMPKAIPGQEGLNKKYVLYSIADSTPTLAEWDFNTDNSKWNFRAH